MIDLTNRWRTTSLPDSWTTPMPFTSFNIFRDSLNPDFCLVGNREREIVDIANGFANKQINESLTNFFNNNGFKYSVITTNSLKAEQQKAESWLQVVSLLVTTRDFNSHFEEEVIWQRKVRFGLV